MTKRRDDTHMLCFDSRSALTFILPRQTFCPVYLACVAKLPRVWYELQSGNALPLQYQSSNQWVIPVIYHFMVGFFTSAHCFSFLCTLPGYQKQNGGLDIIEAFSPSLLVNYKSMGGGRFAIVLCLTLCVSFCCSALIPLSFLWELFFLVLFLRCEVVFWTFSLFLVAFSNCR